MADVQKIAKYLGSLWAALATLTVLFPTAAQFMHISMIEASALKDMYVVAGTTLSGLALLFVLTFAGSIRGEGPVRRASSIAILLGALLLFGFIGLKTTVVYDHMDKQITKTGERVVTTIRKTTATGMLTLESTTQDAGVGTVHEDFYARTSPVEVAALALFSFMLTSFTVAFTTLGVYHYNSQHAAVLPNNRLLSRVQEPKKVDGAEQEEAL